MSVRNARNGAVYFKSILGRLLHVLNGIFKGRFTLSKQNKYVFFSPHNINIVFDRNILVGRIVTPPTLVCKNRMTLQFIFHHNNNLLSTEIFSYG